jgi:HAD superfamily hydrolase (TIGR01509 family)
VVFPRPIRAVVFDMDGLLVDTEAPIRDAMMAVAASMGRELPLSVFMTMVGTTNQVSDAILQAHFGDGFSLDAFSREVRRLIDAVFEAGVALKPGAVELLDLIDERGLPAALATSSSRRAVDRHLPPQVVARFCAFITSESVTRGKPHPEPYLKAAAALNTPPQFCLALEDSHNGVRAAHAAGLMTVMVPDLLEATEEMHAKCVAVMDSLHHVREAMRPGG